MATVSLQSRGLGKGLSALISENSAQNMAGRGSNETPNGLQEISINKLLPGRYQPRSRFDEDALRELATSIAKNGIMQPIVVRVSTEVHGRYEIIAGERRWRAAKQAGLSNVPVIIREMEDKQALELALVENIQRQDLSPLEEANGYQRLMDEFSYTQEQLGGVVGKSRSHVANLLRLLTLPVEVKAMLDSGELTMGHARALLTAENAVALARQIVAGEMNVREAEAFSRQSQGVEKKLRPRSNTPRQNTPKAPPKDSDIVALEETLSHSLGLNVSINDRGQQGEIIIGYESLSQLDEVLRRLGGSI